MGVWCLNIIKKASDQKLENIFLREYTSGVCLLFFKILSFLKFKFIIFAV